PALAPVSWWKGEGNMLDSADGNDASTVTGGLTYAPGVVGQAFDTSFGKIRVVGDPVNLQFTNNFTMESWIYPRADNPSGILYKADNRPGLDPYAMVMNPPSSAGFFVTDTNGVTVSCLGPIQLNQWTHVGCTYSNGIMSVYFNGLLGNQVTTTVQPFAALDTNQSPGIGIGNVGDANFNAPFQGLVDEMTVYGQPLSQLQLQDIYAAGSAGKCPSTGGSCLVTAHAIIGGVTNDFLAGDVWVTNVYNFTAPTNGMTLQITADEDGLLVDSFQLVENPGASPVDYFLPEESLDKVVGEPSKGIWQLEVLDNRAGPLGPTNPPTLVSWQLTLNVETVVPFAIPLTHAIPNTNTVDAFSITYFKVVVPPWASSATNLLYNVNGNPVNLLF